MSDSAGEVAAPLEPLTLDVRGLRLPALAAGPASGPLVVLAHGFPDTLQSMAPLAQALAARGHRAVSVALRGYAPGAMPADRAAHSVADMARDLLACAKALGAERLSLVGHDWGAIAAYAAAGAAATRATHPRVDRLVTLAVPPLAHLLAALPSVPRQVRRSWYIAAFQLPAWPELWLSDGALVERLWRAWSPGFEPPDALLRAAKVWLATPSGRHGALTPYRLMPRMAAGIGARGRESRRLLRAPISAPTLAMTGARDGCIDTRLYDVVAPREASRFRGGLRVERLDGVGHFLHLEAPEQVAELVASHLAATLVG